MQRATRNFRKYLRGDLIVETQVITISKNFDGKPPVAYAAQTMLKERKFSLLPFRREVYTTTTVCDTREDAVKQSRKDYDLFVNTYIFPDGVVIFRDSDLM